jgi:hypothetical protein
LSQFFRNLQQKRNKPNNNETFFNNYRNNRSIGISVTETQNPRTVIAPAIGGRGRREEQRRGKAEKKKGEADALQNPTLIKPTIIAPRLLHSLKSTQNNQNCTVTNYHKYPKNPQKQPFYHFKLIHMT